MSYRKCPGQRVADPPLSEWGNFTRFLEIAEDGFANRQVDIFVNGCALMYDREFWCDDESSLADMKFDQDRWTESWGPHYEITEKQFEIEWEFAEAAPNQPQEYGGEGEACPVPARPDGE